MVENKTMSEKCCYGAFKFGKLGNQLINYCIFFSI